MQRVLVHAVILLMAAPSMVLPTAAEQSCLDPLQFGGWQGQFAKSNQCLNSGSIAMVASLGGAIITNGVVQLGVNPFGQLNVPGTVPSSETLTTTVGLRYSATNAEAIAPGCECEGWGAAYNGTVSGYANNAVDGVVGMTLQDFTTTSSAATSVVSIGSLKVTHDYRPSEKTPFLYEVNITLNNTGASTLSDVRYRRVLDWDVEPTAFNEYVTLALRGVPAIPELVFSSDDGFASANPLSWQSAILCLGPPWTSGFHDCGPYDHGTLVDFAFGDLPPGATRNFFMYLGAANNEFEAQVALDLVNAQLYSLGQPSTELGLLGIPNTFILAFFLPVVDIDVDTDRDATIEDEEDEEKEDKWEKKRGALYMVNYDDDDVDGKSDTLDMDKTTGKPNPADTDIDNAADQNDITPFVIRLKNMQPADVTKVVLKAASIDDVRAIHVFPTIGVGTNAIWGGPGMMAPADLEKDITANVNIPGDTEFGLEGLFFRWTMAGAYGGTFGAGGFDGIVDLELEVTFAAGGKMTDKVQLKVAPYLMLPNTQAGLETWELNAAQLIPGSNGHGGGAPWTQDHIEIGYTHAPGRPKTHMVFQLPYNNPSMPDWPITKLLKPGTGTFLLKENFDMTPPHRGSGDFGGNIELLPPTTDYPKGRIIAGNTISKELYGFLKDQEEQEPLPQGAVDTKWLAVGHLDEIIGIIPKGAGWAIVHADPDRAKALLNPLPDDAVFFATGKTSVGKSLQASGSGAKKLLDAGVDFTQAEWAYAKYLRIIGGTGAGQVAEIDTPNLANGIIPIKTVWNTPTTVAHGPVGPRGPGKCVATCSGPREVPVQQKNDWHTPPDGTSVYLLVEDTKMWYGRVVNTATPPALVDTEFPAIISAKEVKADATLWNLNTDAKAKIDAAINSIKAALEPDPEFIPVPDIFMGIRSAPGALSESIAFMPGAANFQPVGGNVYIPKGFGPKNAAGQDVYEEEIKAKLPAASGFPTLQPVDDWNDYHRNMGEVHCGTNVKREAFAFKWWEK